MADWLATVRVERGIAASGDIVFVSTDTNGSPGGLKEEVLKQLGLSTEIVPDSEKLSPGFCFVAAKGGDRDQIVCFIVTVGEGDVAGALARNLTRALSSKEALSAQSM